MKIEYGIFKPPKNILVAFVKGRWYNVGGRSMSKEVIGSFICCKKYMVVVKLDHGTHVMPYDEWKKVYGKLHPELWNNGKRVRTNRKIS